MMDSNFSAPGQTGLESCDQGVRVPWPPLTPGHQPSFLDEETQMVTEEPPSSAPAFLLGLPRGGVASPFLQNQAFPSPQNPSSTSSSIPSPQYSPSRSPPLTNVCLICGDRASGKHYGAYSCEGCKVIYEKKRLIFVIKPLFSGFFQEISEKEPDF